MAVTIHDVRLPEEIERDAVGGPSFNTTILQLSSGAEKRNIEWSRVKCIYDISYGIQEQDDYELVKSFFYARYGRAYGFRFKDWSDFIIGETDTNTPAQIAVGDGAQNTFQVAKTYTDTGGYSFVRPLTLINLDEMPFSVYFNGVKQTSGVSYNLNPLTGIITTTGGHTPGIGVVVSVLGAFDVPVRFDTDQFKLKIPIYNAGEIDSLSIVELKT